MILHNLLFFCQVRKNAQLVQLGIQLYLGYYLLDKGVPPLLEKNIVTNIPSLSLLGVSLSLVTLEQIQV